MVLPHSIYGIAIFADARKAWAKICASINILPGRTILLLLIGFFLQSQYGAIAQDAKVQDTKAQATNIVFAGDNTNYYPYHFLDADRVPQGFDVELFQRIARNEGWHVEFQFHEWSKTLHLLEIGEVDVVPMFITKNRSQKYLFSTPILLRNYSVFGRRGSEYINSLDKLASHHVAVQYASAAWDELNARSSTMIVPVNSESAAMMSIVNGTADYAIVPDYIGYDTINKNALKNIVAVSPPLLEFPYAFGISRKRPEILERVNAQLRVLQTSGEQDELYMKWLANLVPPSKSYQSGLLTGAWIAVPLLISLALVYVWWRQARIFGMLEYQRAEKETVMRRLAQEQVHFLAYRDPATKLPNRNALHEELNAVLIQAMRRSHHCAVVRLNLANLKLIETIAGQELSDEVICSSAQRLIPRWEEKNIAYFGHGEFAVILEAGDSCQSFENQLLDLVALIQQRIDLKELSLVLDCQAGMAIFPQHGSTADELLRAAEMACATARLGSSGTRVYDQSMEPDPRNLTLLGDLRQALLENSLDYAMQPKLCLSSRRIIGAEMLVRWRHPKYGALSPSLFVPLAEQAGSISAMTIYLVRHAMPHCREWQQSGIDITLSVNVSVNDLADTGLVDAIINAAADLGRMLMLEVTETDIMRDADEILRSIDRLRKCGIRISLDDFGTGHASLTYLQRMAPNELKIDRSFIANLLHSTSDQLIVRTSIQLAHDLNAKVTAEGIEDETTLEWLAHAGCDIAQGFAIAKPMSASELMRTLMDKK